MAPIELTFELPSGGSLITRRISHQKRQLKAIERSENKEDERSPTSCYGQHGESKHAGGGYEGNNGREHERHRKEEFQAENRRVGGRDRYEDYDEFYQQIKKLTRKVSLLEADGVHINKANQVGLGMKSGLIANHQITASSKWSNAYSPWKGRLDSEGVWAPHSSRRVDGEWIQVDMLERRQLSGVVTQGRADLDEWVTSYAILYGDDERYLTPITDECGKEKVFSGNYDRNSHVVQGFPRPIVARFVRLVVRSHWGAISLRMDYIC